jgi:hypothetical protein
MFCSKREALKKCCGCTCIARLPAQDPVMPEHDLQYDVTLLLCGVNYCFMLNMVSEYAVPEVANVHIAFGQECDGETGSLPLPGHIATQ